jgi:hypothetical protein
MLRHGSKTVADVLSIQPEFLAPFVQPPESDVDMGMLRVEMRLGRPFERCVEISFHPTHHVSCKPLQIEPLPEFGRDYQFPDPGIAHLLPLVKPKGNIGPVVSAENPVLSGWREALSRTMYLPCAPQCPVTRLLE